MGLGEPAGQDRRRVRLACLPMDDVDENAHTVNALQRRASVVVQKSLVEGFGLTVTEPMWKAKPVLASAVGGIQDQIVHGESGLLKDPRTSTRSRAMLADLLTDEEYARLLGTGPARGCATSSSATATSRSTSTSSSTSSCPDPARPARSTGSSGCGPSAVASRQQRRAEAGHARGAISH